PRCVRLTTTSSSVPVPPAPWWRHGWRRTAMSTCCCSRPAATIYCETPWYRRRGDFDHWATEAGDEAWNYEHALGIYRRIEDWHGPPDARRRGQGGNVKVTSVRRRRRSWRTCCSPP